MHFCTIVNSNSIDHVKVQYELLRKFNTDVKLHVLVSTTDITEIQSPQYQNLPDSIKCLTVLDLCKEGIGKALFDKYYAANTHVFRWSMKPVLLNYILEKEISNKIIWIDWDIIFFNDYKFLFDDLDSYDVLLTPHWFVIPPFDRENPAQQRNFEYTFERGMYNAGFVAVNKNFSPLLDWWSRACLQICEINPTKGLWGDQSHLNLLPLLSERVGVVHHRGCNVAEWNKTECERVKIGDETLINGKFPIIFIHFTTLTVRNILDGTDELLEPYLNIYATKYKEVTGETLPSILGYKEQQKLNNKKTDPQEIIIDKLIKFKDRIRIRTRFRKFLEG